MISTPLGWLLKGSAQVPPSSELRVRVRGQTRPGWGALQPPFLPVPLPPADCSRQRNRRAQRPARLMSALPRLHVSLTPACGAGGVPPPDTPAGRWRYGQPMGSRAARGPSPRGPGPCGVFPEERGGAEGGGGGAPRANRARDSPVPPRHCSHLSRGRGGSASVYGAERTGEENCSFLITAVRNSKAGLLTGSRSVQGQLNDKASDTPGRL